MNELQEIEMAKARRRMEMSANKEREPCWFCLGGTKIERQYIVSVGEKVTHFFQFTLLGIIIIIIYIYVFEVF